MFEKLIQWSLNEHHKLPWRKDRSLYRTLVSEIMLQQTTVSTVINHFERFIKEYPDFEAVAQATDDQLTISWKGLGYYRRARNLKKACSEIFEKYNNEMPSLFDELKSIPGIGDYTASAIIAIGHDRQEIAIDANLERVLSRIFLIDEMKGPNLQKKIRDLFYKGEIISDRNQYSPRDLNEALMDLGRNYCKANNVFCELCPMKNHCQAYKNNIALSLPKRGDKKKKDAHQLDLLRIVCENKGKILVYEKSEKQWLHGQREIPTFILSCSDITLNQYPPIINECFYYLNSFVSAITKYKINNYVLHINLDEFKNLGLKEEDYFWIEKNDEAANLTTASLKSLKV